MQKIICIIFILIVVLGFSFVHSPQRNNSIDFTLGYFKKQSEVFTITAKELQESISLINSADSTTILTARKKLATCRKAYKSVEFFIEYFFENRVNIFNLPPVFEVEEPFMEYQWPIGLQVVEALLYDDPVAQKKEIMTNLEVVITTAEGLPYYLYGKEITEAEILESLRLELIRITTLGITGFDAPLLKSGIDEASASLHAVAYNLAPYLEQQKNNTADSVSYYLERCSHILNINRDFDSFDRMDFLIRGMLPLQTWVGKLIAQLDLLLNTAPLLNYNAPHILSKDALNVANFHKTERPYTSGMVRLGKRLFSETILSGNGTRSCTSCHSPGKYFTDGYEKSTAFDGHNTVSRNAPSLFYAAYQHGFFLDGRAPSLEDQVLMVLNNPSEMNADFSRSTSLLQKDKKYRRLFKKAFPGVHNDSLITPKHIAKAIAAYEISLPVMTSAFDRYIAGSSSSLSAKEVNGFNLFMGKALCGTCHFLPLFNGLLPPTYHVMELESLGMTKNNNFEMPVPDIDSGRYHFFPIKFYTGVFKTPTVRNAAKTAPYMHNGGFPTLVDVLQFYNKGGGKGLGLDMPYQTLSEKPLQLSDNEMNDITAFIEALTDEQNR